MTSNQHGSYVLGHTRATMAGTMGFAKSRDGANPNKTGPSSDWSLQLDSMKQESLVNAHHHDALNTFSGLVLELPGSD